MRVDKPQTHHSLREQATQIEECQQPKPAINRLTMGRGCIWDPMETLQACKAWSQASIRTEMGSRRNGSDDGQHELGFLRLYGNES